jgi:aryl-alcohol dehydrogenase-like predicted oxidoreductase
MLTRRLGRSNLQSSAIGLGCWTIGGPFTFVDHPAGWGEVNDDESIQAIHLALELGINFFDTAAAYGCGHSERILAQALAGRRKEVIIATKFGHVMDEARLLVTTDNNVPERVRSDCEASLNRLNTDYIDLFQLHAGALDFERALETRNILEELAKEGKIRWYGWSTDDPERARLFAQGKHCATVQYVLNLANDAPLMLAVCEEYDLASLNRGPLGRGLLTGKFSPETTFAPSDIRSRWNLQEGEQKRQLAQMESAREVLSQGGRTLAQAALVWCLTRSPRTIPIPGFRNADQVRENAQAVELGLLSEEQMAQLEKMFGR